MIYHFGDDLEVALNNKGADGRMRSIPKLSARKIQRGGAGRFNNEMRDLYGINPMYSSKSKSVTFSNGGLTRNYRGSSKGK